MTMQSIASGRVVTASVLLAAGIVLAGCGSPLTATTGNKTSAETRTTYATPKTLIALAPDRGAKGEAASDHPATLNRVDVAYLLRDIRVRLDGSRERGIFGRAGKRSAPLFTEATIRRLAKPLASAFGEAGPSQDVVVYVRQAPAKATGDGMVDVGQFFDTDRVSGVRLFVRDQKLHVIAGTVGINPKQAASEEIGQNLGFDGGLTMLRKIAPAGSRSGPQDKTAPLTGEFAQNRSDQGRSDWLVVDYPRLLGSVAGQRPDGGSTALEAMDYTPQRGGQAPVERVETAPAEARNTEARMETLEALRRDGLISEAEYQRRKRALEGGRSESE